MTSSTNARESKLIVYQSEPLMRLLVALNLTPVSLGIAFFFVVSVPLTVSASFVERSGFDNEFLGYFENISWSISMLSILPLIVGFTLRYYQEIPRLFKHLSRGIKDDTQEKQYAAFIERLHTTFNNPLVTLAILAVTLILNWFYFRQILENTPGGSWMINGELLLGLFGTETGFSHIGLFAAVIQIILIYWVLSLLWRGLVLWRGLDRYFNEHNFDIDIDPLHADRCCGLRKIGEVGMILNTVLFFIGTYLSLKVIDKTIVQDLPLASDIGNPLFLGCYAILAPSLFFLPLSAAHRRMRQEKTKFLQPLLDGLRELLQKSTDSEHISLISDIKKLDSQYLALDKRIPVWPLNLKSIETFLATVVFPVMPIILPFVVYIIREGLFQQP